MTAPDTQDELRDKERKAAPERAETVPPMDRDPDTQPKGIGETQQPDTDEDGKPICPQDGAYVEIEKSGDAFECPECGRRFPL